MYRDQKKLNIKDSGMDESEKSDESESATLKKVGSDFDSLYEQFFSSSFFLSTCRWFFFSIFIPQTVFIYLQSISAEAFYATQVNPKSLWTIVHRFSLKNSFYSSETIFKAHKINYFIIDCTETNTFFYYAHQMKQNSSIIAIQLPAQPN